MICWTGAKFFVQSCCFTEHCSCVIVNVQFLIHSTQPWQYNCCVQSSLPGVRDTHNQLRSAKVFVSIFQLCQDLHLGSFSGQRRHPGVSARPHGSRRLRFLHSNSPTKPHPARHPRRPEHGTCNFDTPRPCQSRKPSIMNSFIRMM